MSDPDTIISIVPAADGSWLFLGENGKRISQHITVGHMARMYSELHNDRLRLLATLNDIAEDAASIRKTASDAIEDESILCPYSDTESERFCYFRGQREALTFIVAKACDAINADQADPPDSAAR